MNTYNKIKDSEVAQKVGSGMSSAYEKTKENLQNPQLLKENVKSFYDSTKESISNGIEKVKDPEFRKGVRESVGRGIGSFKSGAENMMDRVSNRFIDPQPREMNSNRGPPANDILNEDSPFDVMSDDEEEEAPNDYKLSDKKDVLKERPEPPLISEVPPEELNKFTPQDIDFDKSPPNKGL